MMYRLDASGCTDAAGIDVPLWPANADDSTSLRIQNRSLTMLHVVVTKDDGSGSIVYDLVPNQTIDESWVDVTLAVCVRSRSTPAQYTAVRIA